MSDQSVPESVPADETAKPVVESVTDLTPDPVTQDAPAPPPPAAVASAETGAPAQWPSAGYPAPPVGYPPAVPVYQAPSPTSNNAVVALILAVVSWVVCPLIAAIVALVFANLASKEIEASGGRVDGQGLVTAAKWVAWINIGVVAAGIVISIFIALLIAIAAGVNAA